MLVAAATGHAAMKIKLLKIKLLPFVILITCFGPHNSFAQDLVAAIRAEVTRTNESLSTYTKRTKIVDGISLEGTEANYYALGDDLKKIAARMYGETYKASVELYYKDDVLIFAYFRFNRYDTQIGLPKPPKIVSSEEKRLYFSSGKLAKFLIGKIEVKADDVRWRESETEIADLAGKLQSEFASKASEGNGQFLRIAGGCVECKSPLTSAAEARI
jgi:hypothetical protein